jgi:hypothetical protein
MKSLPGKRSGGLLASGNRCRWLNWKRVNASEGETMPQLCTICKHPQCKEIDLAIVLGEQSNRVIARQFDLKPDAIRRHRKEHLANILQQAQFEKEHATKLDCFAEMAKCINRLKKLSDACDEELTDPLNPEKYILAPNADQVSILYYDGDVNSSGSPIKKRDSLANLLLMVEGKGSNILIDSVKLKRVDASKRLLEAADTLSKQMERIGKLFGLFTGNIDRERLESTRNAVIEVQRKLSKMHDREWGWEETIDEMLVYNKTPSTAAYLNKLKEDGPNVVTSDLIM